MNSRQTRDSAHAKRKAPKRGEPKRVVRKNEQEPELILGPVAQKPPARLRRFAIWAGKFVAAVALMATLLTFYSDFKPRVAVEPSSPIRPYIPKGSYMSEQPGVHSAPSSTFTVINTSKYTLQNVKAECMEQAARWPGSNEVSTFNITDSSGNKVGPEVVTSGESNIVASFASGAHVPFQCTLASRQYDNDPLRREVPPDWADVKIVVQYKILWFIPLKSRFRFVTENNSDGSTQWLPQP